MNTLLRALAVVAVGCALAGVAQGQVIREADTRSVAGLLDATHPANEFTFKSAGGEILFADIDANVYQIQGRGEEDHEEGGESGACEGPPRATFCLQVVDAMQSVLCWAERPVNPGWQRDPRLLCRLSPSATAGGETYALRVALKPEGEGTCGPTLSAAPIPSEEVPYLLSVSLRRIVQGGNLEPALAQSTNRF
jgi:hypothetical protein